MCGCFSIVLSLFFLLVILILVCGGFVVTCSFNVKMVVASVLLVLTFFGSGLLRVNKWCIIWFGVCIIGLS